MRKRLFLLIFIIILFTSLVISLIIGAFSYEFVKTVFRNNKEEKVARIEKQFEYYEKIVSTIEQGMNESGGTALRKLAGSYRDHASIRKIPPALLNDFARRNDVSHVYFIDSTGTVFNSSLNEDIGLNLFNAGESLKQFLESLRGSGKIYSQGVSVSIRKGKLRHYMYYSPEGSDIIYEISIDVSSYVRKKYNLALYEFLFSDMFGSFYNEYLLSIEIYSVAAGRSWSIVNEGKYFDGSVSLVQKITGDGSASVRKGNMLYFYRMIPAGRYFFNRKSAVIIEFVYDVSFLDRYLRNIFIFSLASGIVISLMLFIIAVRRIDSLFIGRILNITDGLKKIREGEYEHSISDDAGDELSDIAASITGMSRDLHQRSIELSSSNEQLRELSVYINSILESMPSILISIDDEGRVIHWNLEAARFTGVTADNAAGKFLHDVFPGLDRYSEQIGHVMAKRERLEMHKEIFHGGGNTVQSVKNVNIFPFVRKQIGGVIIRIDDITELEMKRQQLERAEKVEMMGTIAGGLAHDFNNIIAVITGAVSYLEFLGTRKGGLTEKDIALNLEIIRKAGEKAGTLVKNLMSVARKEGEVFETINLARVIREMADISSPALSGSIDIIYDYAGPDAMITGVKSQMEQILLNLIVNATDAIRAASEQSMSKGTIRISLEKVESGQTRFSRPMWHVSVEDNGGGIDSSAVQKVFDPLYTTKKQGGGLGLAIVSNIVNSHGGFIDVVSEKGKWTRFSIYLPCA